MREVIRLLEQDGWCLARTRASHRQYQHGAKPGLVTVLPIIGAELIGAVLAMVVARAFYPRVMSEP